MSEQLIDYQKLLVPHEHPDTLEKRKKLVEMLKEGISLDINGKRVTFILKENQGPASNLFCIDVFAAGKRILVVEAMLNLNATTASKMGKSYDKDTPDEYRGIGLVSAATSLLFQVFEHMGVEKVIGRIETDNEPSLNSRLRTKDLVKGGFYEVEVQNVVDTPSWRNSGKKNYSVLTLLNGERREKPLSLADALPK